MGLILSLVAEVWRRSDTVPAISRCVYLPRNEPCCALAKGHVRAARMADTRAMSCERYLGQRATVPREQIPQPIRWRTV